MTGGESSPCKHVLRGIIIIVIIIIFTITVATIVFVNKLLFTNKHTHCGCLAGLYNLQNLLSWSVCQLIPRIHQKLDLMFLFNRKDKKFEQHKTCPLNKNCSYATRILLRTVIIFNLRLLYISSSVLCPSLQYNTPILYWLVIWNMSWQSDTIQDSLKTDGKIR